MTEEQVRERFYLASSVKEVCAFPRVGVGGCAPACPPMKANLVESRMTAVPVLVIWKGVRRQVLHAV